VSPRPRADAAIDAGPILVTGAAGSSAATCRAARTRERQLWPGIAWRGAAHRSPASKWAPVDLLDRRPCTTRSRVRPATVPLRGGAHVGRSWEAVEPTFAINVRGTHHLIEGLREAGVEARVLIPVRQWPTPCPAGASADHPTVPDSPYGPASSRKSCRGGNPEDRGLHRAFNHSAPGMIRVRRVRLCPPDRRHRSGPPAAETPWQSDAVAISPTSAIPCARTGHGTWDARTA
jgi:hypothetical protein